MKRTISAEVGKGAVNHNSRKFRAENVDGSRTDRNIDYCNERIQTVYHQLFDEALKRYNEKQTRSDRRIPNYYEKIRSGNQEKPFHEIILLGHYDISVDDLLSGIAKEKKSEQAGNLILEYLSNGKKTQQVLLRKAQAVGISKRVLYEAKKELNVQSVKEGSQWYWELPEE